MTKVDTRVAIDSIKTKEINEKISTLKDKSSVSDGSHTFEELYHHRALLFATILNTYKEQAWKSKLHEDGTMFDNYFICGIITETGPFTYHFRKEYYNLFQVEELKRAPEWDGHESKDVVRLLSLRGGNHG